MKELFFPGDFKRALESNAQAKDTFEKISDTEKIRYIKWIDEAEDIETQQRRIMDSIEKLAEGQKFES
jgi:uncharacterized protein YdeI (YjbR/CyaY-like superfamily)